MEAASGGLADLLTEQGWQRGDAVAVYAKRSPALVIALLAIVRSGLAFIVLDPKHPPTRSGQCVELSRSRGLLNLAGAGAVPEPVERALAGMGTRLLLDVPNSKNELLAWLTGNAAGGRASVHGGDAGGHSLCGVHVRHHGFAKGHRRVSRPGCAFLRVAENDVRARQEDRVSVLSGLAHDPLLRDVLMPLWSGATVCIPGEDCFEIPYSSTSGCMTSASR